MMNDIIDSANALINGAIMDLALNVAKTAIIADYPFFGLPIINWFFNFFMDQGAKYLSANLQTGADLSIIKIQTDSQKTAYAKAEAALRAIHANGNANDIQIATNNFKLAVGPLIQFDIVRLRSR